MDGKITPYYMYGLIAIGDPIIDTHVQIDESSSECCIIEEGRKRLCFDYGSKIPIADSFQNLGGNAPNVAIGAAKLSMSSALVSTVGQDANGKMAIDALRKQSVDTSLVSVDKKSKTRYSIVLNYQKERTILSYSDHKNYRWPKKLPETEWIYYTGLSSGFEIMQEKLLEHLTKHPTVRLAINPGSYMLKYDLIRLREAIARADVLVVNLEEAEKIAQTTMEKEKNVSSLIHKLLELGAKEVVLTDGERGAWAGNEDEIWQMNPYPVEVVAKTGAGDAFSAGYLAARYHNHDVSHALAWGIANSCSVIQQHGPHAGLLDKKGVEKMINSFPEIKPKLV